MLQLGAQLNLDSQPIVNTIFPGASAELVDQVDAAIAVFFGLGDVVVWPDKLRAAVGILGPALLVHAY